MTQHGWLAVDKPIGVSSMAVVAAAKRVLGSRKAGHAGTLDRPASGVLAIAFGEATKLMSFATDSSKHYRFVVRFGCSTSTDDATGHVTGSTGRVPDDDELLAVLPFFEGDIHQVPPQFSAVKIAGRRAHEIARRGQSAAISARPLAVRELSMLKRHENGDAELRMVCGKGGYVRAIARDLGQALGCLAHVRDLRRIRLGPFDEAGSVHADALASAKLQPVETVLHDHTEVKLMPGEAHRLRNGNPLTRDAVGPAKPAWASLANIPIAVGLLGCGLFRPTRILNLPLPMTSLETVREAPPTLQTP